MKIGATSERFCEAKSVTSGRRNGDVAICSVFREANNAAIMRANLRHRVAGRPLRRCIRAPLLGRLQQHRVVAPKKIPHTPKIPQHRK